MTQDNDRIEELEAEVEQLREIVQEQQDSGGTSRRKFLGGVAAAGVLGASTGTASAQSGVGGGPASDEMAHLRQFLYGGPLDDRASGGVANRLYRDQADGTLYEDDGSGWSEADLGVSNLHSKSVSTESSTITDPSGEPQLEFFGLGQSNEVRDVDNVNQDGFLDRGVLIQDKSDNDFPQRLVLGEGVYIGMQAEDSDGVVKTSEMLKSSGGRTILENDYEGKATVLENKNGGGIRLRTDDGDGNEINRLSITGEYNSTGSVIVNDNADVLRVRATEGLVMESEFNLGGNPLKQLHEIDGVDSAADLEWREFGFDIVNGRLVLKDSNDTVHHFNENLNGTTSDRPSDPAVGQQYFDTDLGQPIWYDGTEWVDAQGAAV